jgi:type II pantothenate kinase
MAAGAGSRPRLSSGVKANSDAIDETITRPGAVRINVTGAFIVSDGTSTPQVTEDDGAVHDTGDIRLPHHTAVVSHVAVDVGTTLTGFTDPSLMG